jgi:hypothetical protein
MNLTDLARVLDERSHDDTGRILHHLRLAGVREKVLRRRRRRAATWVCCAVVGLIAVAALVVPGGATDRTPTPAASTAPGTIAGFPEYAPGARVSAAETASLSVPSTPALVLFSRCEVAEPDLVLLVSVTVDGHTDPDYSPCTADIVGRSLDAAGVAVGRSITVVLAVIGATRFGGSGALIPPEGTLAAAVGERVPFDAYPLPPRPSRLSPLPVDCPGCAVIRSDPANPATAARVTVTWPDETPGFLHVTVNDVYVGTGEWWDYEREGFVMDTARWPTTFGLDLGAGDEVAVEVLPEYLTGDWQLVLRAAT